MKKLRQEFEKRFVVRAENYHGFGMNDPIDVWSWFESQLTKQREELIEEIEKWIENNFEWGKTYKAKTNIDEGKLLEFLKSLKK